MRIESERVAAGSGRGGGDEHPVEPVDEAAVAPLHGKIQRHGFTVSRGQEPIGHNLRVNAQAPGQIADPGRADERAGDPVLGLGYLLGRLGLGSAELAGDHRGGKGVECEAAAGIEALGRSDQAQFGALHEVLVARARAAAACSESVRERKVAEDQLVGDVVTGLGAAGR